MLEHRDRPIWNPELYVLAALAAVTRLSGLFSPNAVVFDETHYERYAGHYFVGMYYVDVHPPLGKLLYAAVARLFGVPASTLLDGQPAVALRVLPALLGALIVPLAYIMVRQLGQSRRAAALASFLILCDNALLVDARFILLEPLLIAFGLGAVVLFLGARARDGNRRLAWLAAAALTAGCAISVKWTGASALGLIGVTWLIDGVSTRMPLRRWIGEGAILAGAPIVVYVACWGIHFSLLPFTGTDDAVMSSRFRQTLIGNPSYRADAHLSLAAKIADVHAAMDAGNRSLQGVTHPAASPWYTWPIMKHPIGLWQDAQHPSTAIVLLGNPVVWWGSAIVFVVASVAFARRRGIPQQRRFSVAFLMGGFLFNFLPFVAIRRVMYLYHYLFAVVWLAVLAAVALDALLGWSADSDGVLTAFRSRRHAAVYWTTAAVALAAFLYFAPLSYGWPLSQSGYDARFWVLHPF